ncbi:MAG: ATP-binding cassette domain-containing protein [Deltaproteobacteria bacterium]
MSLDIAGGEFLAIMGRNASGKSTLTRLLAGLYLPVSGQVEIDGINTRKDSSQRVRQLVGLLLAGADPQFVSNIVEEDLAFGPENQGLSANKIRQRVDTALKMVSMEEFAKHPPYLLSGGQKARIALAGLLAMAPHYLVLDEPFSYLDARSIRELMDILCCWRKEEQNTLILVTHQLETARQADRIVVLESGHICFLGTPDELAGQGNDRLRGWGIEPCETSLLAENINHRLNRNALSDVQQTDQLVELLCRLC